MDQMHGPDPWIRFISTWTSTANQFHGTHPSTRCMDRIHGSNSAWPMPKHNEFMGCICMGMRVHACLCMCMRVYAGVCIRMHTHAYTCIRMHTYAYTCIRMHAHAYTHAYACILTHTHAHTHAYTSRLFRYPCPKHSKPKVGFHEHHLNSCCFVSPGRGIQNPLNSLCF